MRNFCVFGNTTPFHGKIFKILLRKFTWRHRFTLLCSNIVNFFRREIVEIVRYLPNKKFGCFANRHYCTDRAQNLLGPAPSIGPTLFQISSQSVYFRRSYSRTPFLPRRVRAGLRYPWEWWDWSFRAGVPIGAGPPGTTKICKVWLGPLWTPKFLERIFPVS